MTDAKEIRNSDKHFFQIQTFFLIRFLFNNLKFSREERNNKLKLRKVMRIRKTKTKWQFFFKCIRIQH